MQARHDPLYQVDGRKESQNRSTPTPLNWPYWDERVTAQRAAAPPLPVNPASTALAPPNPAATMIRTPKAPPRAIKTRSRASKFMGQRDDILIADRIPSFKSSMAEALRKPFRILIREKVSAVSKSSDAKTQRRNRSATRSAKRRPRGVRRNPSMSLVAISCSTSSPISRAHSRRRSNPVRF